MKKMIQKTAIAAALTAGMLAPQPAFALGEFVELKIHTLECAGILLSDIANGTNNHLEECGIGGTATSNYGGHTTGASKGSCSYFRLTRDVCTADSYCCPSD